MVFRERSALIFYSLKIVWGIERVLLVLLIWDRVLHLSSDKDLGECKTDRVSVLIVVLVVPLSHGVHELVMYVLSIDYEIVFNMEDEVPWVSECSSHSTKFIKVSSNSGLTLLKVVSNIVNNGSKVLNRVKNCVECSVLELTNNTTNSLPCVFSVTEALNTVWDLSLD